MPRLKSKLIRVRDLKNEYEQRTILYCAQCGQEASADRGDYFLLPEDHAFLCTCRARMRLVTKRTVYEEVQI